MSTGDVQRTGQGEGLLVAVVQRAPVLGDVRQNLAAVIQAAQEAAALGARLVVFSECSLTGYMLSRSEAVRLAQTVPGAATRELAAVARRLDVTLVVGMVVAEADLLFNTAVLICPDGSVRQYRKAHVPRLGLDNYCAPGDTGFTPFETPVGRLGLLICYDLRFPEAARTLALRGAELLVIISNWPRDATDYPDLLTRARASENRLPAVIANRTGQEPGAEFVGRSQGVLPDGTVFAEAGPGAEILLVRFDADLVLGRRGLATAAEGPGGLLGDRRPDLYGDLSGGLPLSSSAVSGREAG
jgi:predicted amidohydrolase